MQAPEITNSFEATAMGSNSHETWPAAASTGSMDDGLAHGLFQCAPCGSELEEGGVSQIGQCEPCQKASARPAPAPVEPDLHESSDDEIMDTSFFEVRALPEMSRPSLTEQDAVEKACRHLSASMRSRPTMPPKPGNLNSSWLDWNLGLVCPHGTVHSKVALGWGQMQKSYASTSIAMPGIKSILQPVA